MLVIFFSTIFKIIKDFVYFPLWWYTRGLLELVFFIEKQLQNKVASTGIVVWIKNIFVPMYGRTDVVSRLISFVMRVVQIFYKSIIILFWIVVFFVIFLLWVTIPILVIFLFIRSMFNLVEIDFGFIKQLFLIQ